MSDDLAAKVREHDAKMEDDRATVENAVLLCCSFEDAVREAFAEQPVCASCGEPKAPHGRSLHDPAGYCTGHDCIGYHKAPFALNLFPGEQAAIRRYVFALAPDALNLPAIATALDAAARTAEAADHWYREWWLAKHQRGDSCIWNPQAEHFAEWDFGTADAGVCPHWDGGANPGRCGAGGTAYHECWQRAADHALAAYRATRGGDAG